MSEQEMSDQMQTDLQDVRIGLDVLRHKLEKHGGVTTPEGSACYAIAAQLKGAMEFIETLVPVKA